MDKVQYTRTMDSRPGGAGSGAVAIDASPLTGTWLNFHCESRGIIKLELASESQRLLVRVYGACQPLPCDWGAVEGGLFAAGVGSKVAVGFKAFYDFEFMEVFVAAYLNRRLLVVDTYNTFKDGSGRSSYFLRDHFHQ
jgi:hypothetical protein